jgi:hypothetical protein
LDRFPAPKLQVTKQMVNIGRLGIASCRAEFIQIRQGLIAWFLDLEPGSATPGIAAAGAKRLPTGDSRLDDLPAGRPASPG